MKELKRKHWFESIVWPFRGRKKSAEENIFRKSLSDAPRASSLPLIEEWGSPEDHAA